MKYLKYIIILFLISNINLSFADEQEIKLQNKIKKFTLFDLSRSIDL